MKAEKTVETKPKEPTVYQDVLVEQIEMGYNPRQDFNEEKMATLRTTIKQLGIQQPLIVRRVPPTHKLHESDMVDKDWAVIEIATKARSSFGKDEAAAREAWRDINPLPYLLVAGERRLRCAGELGLKTVPCKIMDLTDKEAADIQAVENLARENLTALEEGMDMQKRRDRGESVEEIMAVYQCSRTVVYNRLALSHLPPVAKTALEMGKIDTSMAELIAKVPGAKLQEEVLAKVLEGETEDYRTEPGEGAVYDPKSTTVVPLSYREARALIFSDYMLLLKKAPFDTKDKGLVPEQGACDKCPRRSGNAKDLFPDIKNPDVCTDPGCFAQKKAALSARRVKELEKEGKLVMAPAVAEKMFGKYGRFNGGNEWVEADEHVSLGEDWKQARMQVEKLKPKARPEPVIVITPDAKELTVYSRKALWEAFEQAGLVKPPKEEKQLTPAEREAARVKQEQEAEETAAENRALRVALVQAAGKISDADLFKALTMYLFDSISIEDERIVLPDIQGLLNKEDDVVAMFTLKNKLNRVLFVDLFQSAQWDGDQVMNHLIKAAGVDVKAIKKAAVQILRDNKAREATLEQEAKPAKPVKKGKKK